MHLVILEANKAGITLTESDVTDMIPKKHFFCYITSFFGKHMVCQCIQKGHGVLLSRRGANLGEVLSRTLKKLHHSSSTLLGFPSQPGCTDDQLLLFCDNINERVHKQIKSTTESDAQTPYDISAFDLQSCIDSIDPIL